MKNTIYEALEIAMEVAKDYAGCGSNRLAILSEALIQLKEELADQKQIALLAKADAEMSREKIKDLEQKLDGANFVAKARGVALNEKQVKTSTQDWFDSKETYDKTSDGDKLSDEKEDYEGGYE